MVVIKRKKMTFYASMVLSDLLRLTSSYNFFLFHSNLQPLIGIAFLTSYHAMFLPWYTTQDQITIITLSIAYNFSTSH